MGAVEVVISIFKSPTSTKKKRAKILKEVKKRKKSKFTKAQRLALSNRMKNLWKSGKLGKRK